MPGKRIICVEFWQSETVARLTEAEQLFFLGLIAHADDQGRLRASPALLRSKMYAYNESITLDMIRERLKAIVDIESIVVYESDGIEYVQIINWWVYQKPQWAQPSKYPAPDGWVEKQRYRRDNKVIAKNWGKNNPAGFEGGAGSQDGYAKNGAEPGPDSDDSLGKTLPKALPKELGKVLGNGYKDNDKDKDKINHDDDETHAHAGTPAHEDANSKKWAEICRLFENNISVLSPITVDDMKSDDWFRLPLDWWEQAIQIAADNNVRKWTYVRGILSRSKELGWAPGLCPKPGAPAAAAIDAGGISDVARAAAAAADRGPIVVDELQETWGEVQRVARTTMGADTFNLWIGPARLVELDDNRALLDVPRLNGSGADVIKRRIQGWLSPAFTSVLNRPIQTEFVAH